MAQTLQTLTDQVLGWIERKDVTSLVPGWVAMVETDIAEQLRARCMIERGGQVVDTAYIGLPGDFLAMESIRDNLTGDMLTLEDHWTGPVSPSNGQCAQPATGYRLVGDCIEFLPHPIASTDPNATIQTVTMVWYARPPPLVNPQDTNAVLDQLFAVYLFGTTKYAAMFELDTDRATQMTDAFNGAVFAANAWKAVSDYTGAPLRAVQGAVF